MSDVAEDARRARLRESFEAARELSHDVRAIEYLLGFLPDQPKDVDAEAVKARLWDARSRIDRITRTMREIWEDIK